VRVEILVKTVYGGVSGNQRRIASQEDMMFAGIILVFGFTLVGIFLLSLHAEHGPGAYDTHE
jgi:hypothetical protein